MALRFDEVSPRSLSSRSDLSGRNIFHLARTDLRDITNLAEFLARSLYLAEISFISARSRLSRRNIFHLSEISSVSRPRSLSSRADLRDIPNLAEISLRTQRDLVYLAETSESLQISPSYCRDLGEISFISPRSQRHYKSRRLLDEMTVISSRSRLSRLDLGEISSRSW